MGIWATIKKQHDDMIKSKTRQDKIEWLKTLDNDSLHEYLTETNGDSDALEEMETRIGSLEGMVE